MAIPMSHNSERSAEPLLELRDLSISFRSSTGLVEAVRGVDLTVYPGQSVAIVGESGSGKSTTAMSILGLLPKNGEVTGGSILFNGEDIAGYSEKQLRELRGTQIGLVPQDPMSNLNPVWRIGTQIKEALTANGLARGKEADERVVELLEEAGLPDAKRRARQYPHEFSGGMRQRALIAQGLAGRPKLLIADEPTSALDVTVQKTILDHIGELAGKLGVAVLFITHDLGLAAERASHLVVMRRGRVVESGPSREILAAPRHPYTRRLVDAAPSLEAAGGRAQARAAAGEGEEEPSAPAPAPVIEVENLVKEFDVRGKRGKKEKLRAVDDVSFSVERGTTTALVGESGSGKSTVANLILRLIEPTSGTVRLGGHDVSSLDRKGLSEMRRRVQVVFQNPYGSLDPTYPIARTIEEPLELHRVGTKKERRARVAELLDLVALPASTARRYPNELSGGQRQRIAIARALALNPEVIVLDEAVSALDVVVQDQVMGLLQGLQRDLGLSYLFITHDLAVVAEIADDVVVMRSGKVVEQGATERVFSSPEADYTRALLDAVPGAGLVGSA